MPRDTKYGDQSEWISWLHRGDKMDQPEFHRAYSDMPDEYRAELIGGMVFEPSPLSVEHSETHGHLITAFFTYAGRTRGLQAGDNATVILGPEDEVQPDVFLRILPEYGGRSKTIARRDRSISRKPLKYVKGTPELLAEVAHSSRAIDLHFKKERYRLAGVQEYLVVCLDPERIYWFDMSTGNEFVCQFDIFQSKVFPGLWINGEALFKSDFNALMESVDAGMRSSEYALFRDKLSLAKN